MKFNYFIPNILEGRFAGMGTVTWESLQVRAKAAEELGFDNIGVGEFIETQQDVATGFPGEPPRNYAPLTTMAALAMITSKVRIQSFVLVLPYHDPLILAREMATLDTISGGRAILGVGIGGEIEDYRRTRRQLGSVNRSQMMDESVEAMRALWTEPTASFHGKYFAFDDVQTYPKPVQDPFPVYFAGNTEGLMRRVARYGQGWIQMTANPQLMSKQMSQIKQYLAEEGRGGDDIEYIRQFFMSIGETEEEAEDNRRNAVKFKTQPVPRKGIARASSEGQERLVVGSVDQIRRRLHDYAEIGVTEMGISLYEPDLSASLRQLELFATRVIPDFKA